MSPWLLSLLKFYRVTLSWTSRMQIWRAHQPGWLNWTIAALPLVTSMWSMLPCQSMLIRNNHCYCIVTDVTVDIVLTVLKCPMLWYRYLCLMLVLYCCLKAVLYAFTVLIIFLQAIYSTNNKNAPPYFYQCADIGVRKAGRKEGWSYVVLRLRHIAAENCV